MRLQRVRALPHEYEAPCDVFYGHRCSSRCVRRSGMMREQLALSMALVLTLGVLPSAVRAQTPPPATTLFPVVFLSVGMQTPPSIPPQKPLPTPPKIRPF